MLMRTGILSTSHSDKVVYQRCGLSGLGHWDEGNAHSDAKELRDVGNFQASPTFRQVQFPIQVRGRLYLISRRLWRLEIEVEVLTELDSKQRELLMRMYRSWLNEEVFPVSFDMGGVGETLMQCGFIVAVNGFYEFTEPGLKEWQVYGDKLNATYQYHAKLSQEKRKAEAQRKKWRRKS